MELVHTTTDDVSNVPFNAALLLISTTLKEMSMPTFRNKIAREVDKIQQRSAIVNIMCVLEEDDIEHHQTGRYGKDVDPRFVVHGNPSFPKNP